MTFGKSKLRKATQGDPTAGPFTLPPQSVLELKLAFTPPSQKDETLAKSEAAKTGKDQSLKLKRSIFGGLNIGYANGHNQEIMLRADILRPMVIVAPAIHKFGAVHVERPMPVTLYLSNPTVVDVEWRVRHIPWERPPRRVGAAPIADEDLPFDKPDVFKFGKVAGVIAGPSMPLRTVSAKNPEGLFDAARAPVPVTVSFAPEKDGYYRSRFRFVVTKGESFDVVLVGKGSYEEGVDVPR
jgi:hypothetical protein